MVTYISQYQIERAPRGHKHENCVLLQREKAGGKFWFRWRILLVEYLLGHWGGFVNFSILDWKFQWNVGGKVFGGPRHCPEIAPYLPILLFLTWQCFFYKFQFSRTMTIVDNFDIRSRLPQCTLGPIYLIWPCCAMMTKITLKKSETGSP